MFFIETEIETEIEEEFVLIRRESGEAFAPFLFVNNRLETPHLPAGTHGSAVFFGGGKGEIQNRK